MFNFKKGVSVIIIFSFVLAACSPKQGAGITRTEQLQREQEEREEQERQEQQPAGSINKLPLLPDDKRTEEEIHMEHIKNNESLADKKIKLLEYAKAEAEVAAKMLELAQEWSMTQTEKWDKMADPRDSLPIRWRVNEASINKRLAISNNMGARHRAEDAQEREKELLLLAEKGLPEGEVEPDGMRDNARRAAITEQYIAQKEKELMEKWHDLVVGWKAVEEQEEKTLKVLFSFEPADNGKQGLELLSPKKRVMNMMNIKILDSLADKEIKLLELEEVKAKAGEDELKLVQGGQEMNQLETRIRQHLSEQCIDAKKNKNRARDLLLAIEAAAAGEVEPDVAQKEMEKWLELSIRWGEVEERARKTLKAWNELGY